MKIQLVVALAGLAIGLALPTFAQQTNTPDPQLRQALDAVVKKFDDAYNNNDPTALTVLYTEDAVLVNDKGPIYGREALETYFADLFQKVHFSNHLGKVDKYSPHIIGTAGNETWATGEWSSTIKGPNFGPVEVKGYWAAIKVREGDTLKTRMDIWNVTPAPAAPAQTK
jgi:ketosteroid isomerase-like protein